MTSLTSYRMEDNVENEQKNEIFEKSLETPNRQTNRGLTILKQNIPTKYN